MSEWKQWIDPLQQGNRRALARAITLVENDAEQGASLLSHLSIKHTIPIVGITGPPGAGKSSLITSLTEYWIRSGKQVGILAVDPSSPFNKGALMGDRVRMSAHFTHPNVFIRSMASRGSLGGLSPRIYEAADVMRAAGFDYVLIETVGVGQSEIDIAALADTTVLVLVPEAGDDIQTIKSGIMEIADIFVVNKSDRDGADSFAKFLHALAHEHSTEENQPSVLKTSTVLQTGINDLAEAITAHNNRTKNTTKRLHILAEKTLTLIREWRTKDISFDHLMKDLSVASQDENFNLYRYVSKYK